MRCYCKDCFAFRTVTKNRYRCEILDEMICKKKECPFYKTNTQYLVGIQQLEERERQKGQE